MFQTSSVGNSIDSIGYPRSFKIPAKLPHPIYTDIAKRLLDTPSGPVGCSLHCDQSSAKSPYSKSYLEKTTPSTRTSTETSGNNVRGGVEKLVAVTYPVGKP